MRTPLVAVLLLLPSLACQIFERARQMDPNNRWLRRLEGVLLALEAERN